MKTLGLIGGTTWLSTAEYYRIINQEINTRLGRRNSAQLILRAINFEQFTALANSSNWEKIKDWYTDISLQLQHAGADCILICANTPHIVADHIQQAIKIPLIHIAEEAALQIDRQNIRTVGLLGTKFTMEHSFFKDRLLRHGITAMIPGDQDREFIHSSIQDEFAKGIFRDEVKRKFLEIINGLERDGAEGMIFGCTEIPLLIKPDDCPMPTFDTTLIHATAAVDFALEMQ